MKTFIVLNLCFVAVSKGITFIKQPSVQKHELLSETAGKFSFDMPKVDFEAIKKNTEEAAKKAQEEAAKQAEDAKRKLEEEAKKQLEEASRKAEEAKKKAEQEAK